MNEAGPIVAAPADMTMLGLILVAALAVLALAFAWYRGKALLMFYQQEEYDSPRFINWLREKKGYDKSASAAIAVALLLAGTGLATLSPFIPYAVLALVAMGLTHGITRSMKATSDNKKPLVMTQRAKKIFSVYMALSAGVLIIAWSVALLAANGWRIVLELDMESLTDPVQDYDWRIAAMTGLLLVFVQVLPFLLTAANKLLEPIEERVKAGFRNEAIDKLAKLKPSIIAITGSFGKTSTKHILNHILSVAKPTLATPGSVNTDMGITRIIREQLTPEHEYFIVEMGAYGPGSIARLCRLAPPDFGLITAVGAAHFERFKSLETVARTKFELAESVFERGGPMAVNSDTIRKDLLADRLENVKGDYRLTGDHLKLTNLEMIREGVRLTLHEGDDEQIIQAPLYGRHQGENIVLAVMAARMMGLPWSIIRASMRTMPQIRHRVEVSGVAQGPAVINDAYNSNPEGFLCALEVLDVLVREGGRRILVTPGMVELGEQHESEHARLGEAAAKHCDVVLVVTPDRIPTFVEGVTRANDGGTSIMTFERQEEAEAWVNSHIKAEDVVLFENNLPDLFEAKVSF